MVRLSCSSICCSFLLRFFYTTTFTLLSSWLFLYVRESGGVGGSTSDGVRGSSGFFGVSLGGMMFLYTGKLTFLMSFDVFFGIWVFFMGFWGKFFWSCQVEVFTDVFAGEFFRLWSVAGWGELRWLGCVLVV